MTAREGHSESLEQGPAAGRWALDRAGSAERSESADAGLPGSRGRERCSELRLHPEASQGELAMQFPSPGRVVVSDSAEPDRLSTKMPETVHKFECCIGVAREVQN